MDGVELSREKLHCLNQDVDAVLEVVRKHAARAELAHARAQPSHTLRLLFGRAGVRVRRRIHHAQRRLLLAAR